MDLDIVNVDYTANEWDVTKAIAAVLHNEDGFKQPEGERQLNFKVVLHARDVGVRNDGTGVLTLPSPKIGQKFLKWMKKESNCIEVHEKKLRFFRGKTRPLLGLAMTLDKTPYLDPDIEEERQRTIRALDVHLRIDKVQIGLFYRPSPGAGREFSIEWEGSFIDKSLGWLSWEYEHKLMRVRIGDPMTEQTNSSIVIQFSNIRKLGINYDFGNPYLCFDLVTPPMFEQEDFNRPLTGDERKDSRKFRRRIGSLHPGHARVAPYCHHLRIVLYQGEDLDNFEALCKTAGLQKPIRTRIDAYQHGYCSLNRLHMVHVWLRALEWRIAFQLEAILHNGLLNTEDLLTHLYAPINQLCRDHSEVASEVLRYFTEALQSVPAKESPLQCFERTRDRKLNVSLPRLPPGTFHCHHVCFAPTRMILEGPYVIQSNRVIREWAAYQDNFIRVDFRDEDRLQYRWDREVDGKTFLDERVGDVLKNGFELAGREFEFLAYSSSALREHAVWFMQPFQHPDKGWIDSAYIRGTLGEFTGVIHQPSKYAARIAQAFTATDPSVRITRDQWEEVDDLGKAPYYFTDGVGTISQQLGDKIWETLCAARRDHGQHAVKPSAYQIRFLGYKGVVGVDETLQGIMMRLRPSMNKFKGRQEYDAEIEIARAFSRPNTSYLNRQVSMVMILEDRGVKKDSFMALQDMAVADARTIDDSLVQFRQVLKAHSLGGGFRLDFILDQLMKLGLDLKSHNPEQRLDNPFLAQVRHFAMTHVLRDIKHGARIPIPRSWLLVGVADEGPAYVGPGSQNVYKLPKGKIYACVQTPDDEKPIFLKGSCTISRSPVVHPGDIQRVYAIGEPPTDQLCLFRNMKNVVVLPSIGDRSLSSCLGGGDLDGDLYDIIFHGPLLPTEHIDPASYPPGRTRENEGKKPSTVNDICDFIVEYINSDVLGLLSDRHLTIADQSKHGTRDDNCIKLAELCSQAVDYPKNGIPVNIDRCPRFLIPYKPDWHAAEVAAPRRTDYYDSDRALGHLYRAIEIDDPVTLLSSRSPNCPPQTTLADPISTALKPFVRESLQKYTDLEGIRRLFQTYVDELAYICLTHTVSPTTSNMRLQEEEIVVGTILAKCSQRRWRKDRMHRMRTHSQVLVQEIQRDLINNLERASPEQILRSLMKAWTAWEFSIRHSADFGANSFGLIALGIIFDCLEKLDENAKV